MADNWNDNIIAEFRANGGKVGGIVAAEQHALLAGAALATEL